jgi:hypothetical protein
VTLLTLAVVGMNQAPGASGSQQPEGEVNPLPNDRNAPPHSERWYDDARELPDVDSPSPIRPNARSHFGSRFGAIWYDRDASPTRLVFGVAAPTEHDHAFVRNLTKNDPRTDVLTVKYGAAQLDGWRDQIEPIALRSAKRTSAMLTVAIDPISASITIEENPLDPGLRSEIDATGVPSDAYTLKVGGGTETLHATRETFPPYEGGLRVVLSDGAAHNVACTTWFTGKRNGTPRGVTAGHCNAVGIVVNPNDNAFIGNDNLGRPGGNSYDADTNSDAVRLAINSSQLTNRINTGPNTHRTVKAPRYTTADLDTLNKEICFNAVVSGGECGFLTARDFTATDTRGATHRHLYAIEATSQDGDSGGPVYGIRTNDGTARVAGIVMGRNPLTLRMHFHAAGWVLNDLGMCIYYETTPCE